MTAAGAHVWYDRYGHLAIREDDEQALLRAIYDSQNEPKNGTKRKGGTK